MIKHILYGLLGLLAMTGVASAACPNPNPNILAPPFYDGCPLPVVGLNTMATRIANNTVAINNLVNNNTFASAASVANLTNTVNTNTGNIATNATNIGYVSSTIGRSLLSFGVVPNGIVDNAVAIASATSWAEAQGAVGATLLVPMGTTYSTAPLAVTMPAAGAHLAIQGAGKGVSQMLFGASINGIDITMANVAVGQAFDIEGLTLRTNDTTDTYAAISVHNVTPYYTPQSVIRNVMTIGNGFDPVSRGASTIWGTGIKLHNISDVLIDSTDLYGNDTVVHAGVGISAASTGVTGSLTIVGLNTHGLDIGISIGDYTQGVQVANSNLEAQVGINVAGSVVGLTELNVSGVSFNFAAAANSTGISLGSVLSGFTLTNSEFAFSTGFAGTVYGVALTDVEGCSIIGNSFQGQNTAVPVSIGVRVNGPTTGGGCNIIGNYFEVLTKGIELRGASDQGGYVSGNVFKGNVVTPCVNDTAPLDRNYILYGCYTTGQFNLSQKVTGAVTDTHGTKITISDTSAFVSGDVVVWGGISGIDYPQGIGPVEVVDSSHLVLLTANFGGSYGSGGSISIVP